VNSNHDREAAVERLLRQSLRAQQEGGAAGACLDAETLAAWADGTLSNDAVAAAEQHVADCSRCLAMVSAITQSTPIDETREPWWSRIGPARWLIPVAAAATAVAIWVAVPQQEVTTPVTSITRQTPADELGLAEVQSQAEALNEAAPLAADAEPRRDVAPEGDRAALRAPASAPAAVPAEASASARTEATAVPPPASLAGLPSATPPAAAAQEASGVSAASAVARRTGPVPGGTEIVSPDPSSRWRLGGAGALQRSVDGGASWTSAATGVAVDLTSGVAPSPSVCWIVGRAGTVLLTTDGETWRRLAFPERVDLAGVRATDARRAAVTTADGRVFATTDGGLTWDR